VALQVDVEAGGGISEFKIPSAPVHFNVCFDEPILGQPGARDSRVQLQQTTASWQSRSKQPLLIASGLSPAEARALLPALKKLTVPMVLEATSNLSGHEALKDLQIPTWSVRAENFYEHFDSLIRVGSVPTLRLFRDLDLSLSKVPVLSFTDKPFSGLARQSNQCLNSLADLNDFIEAVHFDTNASLQVLKADVERLQGAISEFPESELMCFVQLKKALPANSRLFLGNSLPIREWDAVCDFENDRSQEVYAQRGVNGIDGLVSQFLGMCVDGRENVLILGDLSFLYDSSGLWALEQLQPLLNIKIVVVNNSGGRIFRGLFENAMLQTEHKFEMRGLSDFWGLDYVKVTGKGIQHFDYLELPQRCLVEFQPELNASDQAWKSLRALYV
jgi:2-succinyl-5-enolpyruvyl-6-hydroxy-3-cyclohexene-1-carboxylate synthase